MNYAEITKQAFDLLVTSDTPTTEVETLEHGRKYHYYEHGVVLLAIDNFLTVTTQYYIQDINA